MDTRAEATLGHRARSALEGLVSSLGFMCCGETGSMCGRVCPPRPKTAGAAIGISFCHSGFEGPKCHHALCEKGESSACCSESTTTAQAVTIIAGCACWLPRVTGG